LEYLKRRSDWEDHGVDGKIVLKYISKGLGCEGVGWIHIVQDTNQTPSLVNMVP
jgi:hypothetical protein